VAAGDVTTRAVCSPPAVAPLILKDGPDPLHVRPSGACLYFSQWAFWEKALLKRRKRRRVRGALTQEPTISSVANRRVRTPRETHEPRRAHDDPYTPDRLDISARASALPPFRSARGEQRRAPFLHSNQKTLIIGP
jgi:hypothetical protein